MDVLIPYLTYLNKHVVNIFSDLGPVEILYLQWN